jgi:hypothetical protein
MMNRVALRPRPRHVSLSLLIVLRHTSCFGHRCKSLCHGRAADGLAIQDPCIDGDQQKATRRKAFRRRKNGQENGRRRVVLHAEGLAATHNRNVPL